MSRLTLTAPNHEKPQNKKGSYFRNYLIHRAENGTRTRDLNLGKVALYQLSYVRMCYLHRQQVTKIRQSQEKAKPPRVPPVFQRLSSAEVKFPDYADVPSFMESGTVWASSLNAR